MLVLMCGSRGWTDDGRILQDVQRLVEVQRDVLPDGERVRVMHGGARGADRLAGACADIYGIPVDVVPADWDADGKAAGFKRNIRMLERGPDLVLAYWDGESRGTLHTIREAIKRDVKVVVRLADGTTEYRNCRPADVDPAEVCPDCDLKPNCSRVKGSDDCMLTSM